MAYKINYNTGAGDEQDFPSIGEAQAAADEGAAYTQQPIVIEDEDGNEVARRAWWGVLDGIEDASDPIQFGTSGYYGDWQD